MNSPTDRTTGNSKPEGDTGPIHTGAANDSSDRHGDENKLSDVLSEFARTMITDFPIQRPLRETDP